MEMDGLAWPISCLALGALWVLAASWRAEGGAARIAFRGLLGGLAALGLASVGYGVVQLSGIDLRWEWIARGAWPALGLAAVVGVVEEGAKLAGIVLAAPPARHGRRSVLRVATSVAAVFAIAEAALVLGGSSWPVALSRAAFGPVAHGVLAAPFAVALADATGISRPRFTLRLAVAVALAALLHGLGDWSVARPGWGRVGFAAALMAPTLWLYARGRAPRLSTVRSAAGSAHHTP